MSIQYEEKHGGNNTEPMLMIDRRDEKRKNVKIIGQIMAATSGKCLCENGQKTHLQVQSLITTTTYYQLLQIGVFITFFVICVKRNILCFKLGQKRTGVIAKCFIS